MTDSNHDQLELTLDEREMEALIVQSETEDVHVAIAPTGATRDTHPQRPAAQSLVNRLRNPVRNPVRKPVKCNLSKESALRQMQAQIEELQQKQLVLVATQDTQARENQNLKNEVAALKRQRLDSIGNSVSTSSSYRSTSGSASSTRGETRFPKDDSQEEAHLSNLCISGPDMPPELAAPEYTYSWSKRGNASPMVRARIIPKLEKMSLDHYVLQKMSTTKLMDYLCYICSLLYNCGTTDQVPDWVPEIYVSCPVLTIMKKLEILSPACYFSMIRRPAFLKEDLLGIHRKFYLIPVSLPSGENAQTVIMQARGRYEHYTFAGRKVLARLKAREEFTPAAQSSVPSDPLPTPAIQPAAESSTEPVNQRDLRDNLEPKMKDLRDKITPKKKVTSKKPWMQGKDLTYSAIKLGTAEQDIRERQKKEREAEKALLEARALRVAAEENEARVVDSQIKDLCSYKEALIKDSTQRQGKQYPLLSRKRDRSRTHSRSPSRTPTPTPSSSWSSVSGAERRRATVRTGKGKDRRRSYSRSPTPARRPATTRNTDRSIPGLSMADDRRSSRSRREFTPSRSPPRRSTPGTPTRSPSWQAVASRRSRRERR